MQGDASERIPILLHHCRQSVVDMAVEPPKTTEHPNDVYMLAPTVFRTAASGNLPRGDTETEIWRMCQIFSAAAGVDSTRFVNKPLSLNRPLIDKGAAYSEAGFRRQPRSSRPGMLPLQVH